MLLLIFFGRLPHKNLFFGRHSINTGRLLCSTTKQKPATITMMPATAASSSSKKRPRSSSSSTHQATSSSSATEVEAATATPTEKISDYFCSAVTQSFSGTSTIAQGSKMDRPSVPVFALTVLISMMKNKPPQMVGGGGVAAFRKKVVEPQLKTLIEKNYGDKLVFKQALECILNFAKEDVMMSSSGTETFPILKPICIDIGQRESNCGDVNLLTMEVNVFDFIPDEGKYSAEDYSSPSYFQALKKLCYFLQRHPLFRFSSAKAREEFFDNLQGSVCEKAMEEAMQKIENAKEKANQEKAGIKERMSELQNGKNSHAAEIQKIEKDIVADESKLSQANHAMGAFMESMLSCIDDDMEPSFNDMREANKRHFKCLTTKLEESILKKKEVKTSIEAKISEMHEELKSCEMKIKEWGARKDFLSLPSSSLLVGKEEVSRRVKKSLASYIEPFKPILQCVEEASCTMKELLAAMKELISCTEVIQEGLFSMKTSLETFLDEESSSAAAASSSIMENE